jgi:hypothetical protein
MEKVYVVYDSCVSDYEDCSGSPRVFKNLSDAKEYMINEFKDAISDMTECDCKEETEMCCEIWEDGDYSRNYYKISIEECEVN